MIFGVCGISLLRCPYFGFSGLGLSSGKLRKEANLDKLRVGCNYELAFVLFPVTSRTMEFPPRGRSRWIYFLPIRAAPGGFFNSPMPNYNIKKCTPLVYKYNASGNIPTLRMLQKTCRGDASLEMPDYCVCDIYFG